MSVAVLVTAFRTPETSAQVGLPSGFANSGARAIAGILHLQECGSKVSRIFSIGDDAFYLCHKDSNLAHITKRSFKPYGEIGQRQNSQQPNLSNRLKDTASAALITDS